MRHQDATLAILMYSITILILSHPTTTGRTLLYTRVKSKVAPILCGHPCGMKKYKATHRGTTVLDYVSVHPFAFQLRYKTIHCTKLHLLHPQLKGLGNGARFSKYDIYKTFPAEKVSSKKGDPFGWKGLVKVTFYSLFLNQTSFPIPLGY